MVLQGHPLVAEAAAFPLPHARLGEEVAAAVRLRSGAAISDDELRAYVAARVAEFKVPRRIIFVDVIPKSSAGKVRRSAMAELLGSRLRTTESAETAGAEDSLAGQLRAIWERLLRVSPVGLRDNFFDLGGHSILAVALFEEIEKMTGRSYPLATLLEAPTIERLAAVLRRKGERGPRTSLVPIQPEGSNPPLFCAHGGGGNVLSFEALARHLGKDQPLYGLQSHGLDGGEPLTRIEDMAALYIKDILEFQKEGPYYLEGMSFGGLVALEMAHQLTSRGKMVALLALLDTYPKGVQKTLRRESVRRKIELRLSEFLALERADQKAFLKNRSEEMVRLIGNRLRRVIPFLKRTETSQTARTVRTVREANRIASLRYEPKPYHGAVTLFWARKSLVNSTYRFRAGWDMLAPERLEMIAVPGTHITMFEEPNVKILAREVNRCIQRARAQEGSGT